MSTTGLRRQINDLKSQLRNLLERSHKKEAIEQIREIDIKIDELEAQEEEMRFQWSRQSWLTEGDKNNAFFHQKASQRRHPNTINRLQDGNDHWVEDEEQLEKLLLDYFNNIYKSKGVQDLSQIIDLVQPRITAEMNQRLMHPYTPQEVFDALMQMPQQRPLA